MLPVWPGGLYEEGVPSTDRRIGLGVCWPLPLVLLLHLLRKAGPTEVLVEDLEGEANRGQACVYALTRQDVQALNVLVSGTLLVCSGEACVLFDPGSTHSYVSPTFAKCFDERPIRLESPLLVATRWVGHCLLSMGIENVKCH